MKAKGKQRESRVRTRFLSERDLAISKLSDDIVADNGECSVLSTLLFLRLFHFFLCIGERKRE